MGFRGWDSQICRLWRQSKVFKGTPKCCPFPSPTAVLCPQLSPTQAQTCRSQELTSSITKGLTSQTARSHKAWGCSSFSFRVLPWTWRVPSIWPSNSQSACLASTYLFLEANYYNTDAKNTSCFTKDPGLHFKSASKNTEKPNLHYYVPGSWEYLERHTQSLSHVWLFVTPWTVTLPASLFMELSRIRK